MPNNIEEVLKDIPPEMLDSLKNLLQDAGDDPTKINQIQAELTLSICRGQIAPTDLLTKKIDHRHSLQKLQAEGWERRADRGQFFSLAIAITALICGTYVITKLDSYVGLVGGISIIAIGVVTPTALHIARGIRHLLGDKSEK